MFGPRTGTAVGRGEIGQKDSQRVIGRLHSNGADRMITRRALLGALLAGGGLLGLGLAGG